MSMAVQNRYTEEQRKYIKHNQRIIEDNIFYGIKYGYTDDEIAEYKASANRNMKEFKAFLLAGGKPAYDENTEMYVLQ